MSVEALISHLQEAVAHGTNPKDEVVAWTEFGLEKVTGFIHGGTDGKVELTFDDVD